MKEKGNYREVSYIFRDAKNDFESEGKQKWVVSTAAFAWVLEFPSQAWLRLRKDI